MRIEWDTASAARGAGAQVRNLREIASLITRVRRVQGAAPAALGFAAKSAVERGGNDLVAALQAQARTLDADTRELRKRVNHMMAVEADGMKYKPMSNWDIAWGTVTGTASGVKDIFWDEPVGTLKDPNASAGSKAWAAFNIVTLPIPVAKVTKLGSAAKATSGAIKGSRVTRAAGAGADALQSTKLAKSAATAAKASRVGKAVAPALTTMRNIGAAIGRGWSRAEEALFSARTWVRSAVTPTRVINRVLDLPPVVRYRRTVTALNRIANSDLRMILHVGRRLRLGAIRRGQHSITQSMRAPNKAGVYGDGLRGLILGPKGTAPKPWRRPQFIDGPRGAKQVERFVDDVRTAPIRRTVLGTDGSLYQERVMNQVVGRLPNGKPTTIVTVRLSGPGGVLTDLHPGPMKAPKRPWYSPLPGKPTFVEMGPTWKLPGFTIKTDKDGQPHLRFTGVEPPKWKPAERKTWLSETWVDVAKKWRVAR